jgi:xanthine/uracil permease
MRPQRDVVEPFPGPKADRSIGALFSDLARETSLLLRQEVALAKAEIAEKASQAGMGVGMLAAGGFVAFAGLLYLLAAAMLALGKVVDLWLAALIVGVVVMAIGGILAYVGMNKFKSDNLVPRRTIRTLKDDTEWAKEQAR